MKVSRLMVSLTCVGVPLIAASPTPSANTQYAVFCANDRIEIDMRSLEQMRGARGSGVCLLGSFDYLSDAQSFAKKNFGGEGAACRCR